VLATYDGGVQRASGALTLPANACMPNACMADSCCISPPQFFRGTGFLIIAHGGRGPCLLVTQDTGTTWHAAAVPQAAGPFDSARFFSARQGLLIPALAQDTPGRVFYLTSDGGQTRTPIRQGIRFQPGMTVNLVSPDTGFASNPDASGAPPIYATTNGGLTWTWYLPQLARGQRQSCQRPSGSARGRPSGLRRPAKAVE
jgi:hypothetical protein